jgi:sulfonate dioxygenase
VTGWKTLYVNENFTKEIVGLERRFSDSLLGNLNRTVAEAYEYQVRWKWTENAVAIWDNRATLHTGIFDYCKLPFNSSYSMGRKQFQADQQIPIFDMV